MRIPGIDHIGMASADLGRHIEIFGDKLGLEIHDIHEKDPYHARRPRRRAPRHRRAPPRGARIEDRLIHPKSTGGILIRFVERPDHG
jgi:catechol 2,3-dioxygenase-like lactoylglutathione lyase family enzyme